MTVSRRPRERVKGAEASVVHVDPDAVDLMEGVDPERLDAPVNPLHLDNVRRVGLLSIVLGRRRGGRIQVVAGRQRTKWMRALKAEAERDGRPVQMLPVLLRPMDEMAAIAAAVSENAIRVEDAPMARVRKMERLHELGLTHDAIAELCGCGRIHVTRLLGLRRLAPDLQEAYDRGELGYDAAVSLSRLPPEEQVTAVQTAIYNRQSQRREAEAAHDADEARAWYEHQQPAGEPSAALARNGTNVGASSAGRSEKPAAKGKEPAPAPRRDPMGFYRTGNRIRDLTRFILQVDPRALPAEFNLLLLWILHDPGTKAEHLTARWPRLAAFFAP